MTRAHAIRLVVSIAAALMLGVAVLSMQGCAGTRSAYQEASTLDEYAYVLTEHYSALVAQAATLAALPTTPAAAKAALKAADNAAHLIIVGDAKAVPRVAGIAELAANYKQARDAKSQEELQRAVDALVLRLADLVRTVKASGAR